MSGDGGQQALVDYVLFDRYSRERLLDVNVLRRAGKASVKFMVALGTERITFA